MVPGALRSRGVSGSISDPVCRSSFGFGFRSQRPGSQVRVRIRLSNSAFGRNETALDLVSGDDLSAGPVSDLVFARSGLVRKSGFHSAFG